MTPKEAIYALDRETEVRPDDFAEAYDMAKESLKFRTREKPIIVKQEQTIGKHTYVEVHYCPVCKKMLYPVQLKSGTCELHMFCPNCGQAIDYEGNYEFLLR